MGKAPVRNNNTTKKTMGNDKTKAAKKLSLVRKSPREAMKDCTYIPCDYEAATPSNLKQENKASYDEYTQTIAKDFAVEYAGDLDEQVDKARGNGKMDGRNNKERRYAHEKKYLYQRYKISHLGSHCEETANTICKVDTIKNVQGADIYLNRPEDNYCPTANVKNYAMCKQHPEIGGGYVNIKQYVAEVQKHDPYCIIDTVVPSNGNFSGSGLHRVTIAPTVDKNGNVVMDEKTGLPKMTVYSFNKASKTSLESYDISNGFCVNMNDFARHNLKEEYQKNPEKTQEEINQYLAERKKENPTKLNIAQMVRNNSSNSM